MKRERLAEVALGLGLAAASVAIHPSLWAQGERAAAPTSSWAPADAPARPLAVAYTWTARLDADAHAVDGEGQVQWTNTSSEPQSEIYVHLYLNAFRDERSYFMRSEAGAGFRGGEQPDHWGKIVVSRWALEGESLWPEVVHSPGDPEDATDIRVALPAPVEPGRTVTFDVAFRSELPSVVARTGFDGSFHMVAQWFPKVARLEPDGTWRHFRFHRLSEFYADFGRFDVRLDVPSEVVVGATGVRVSAEDAGGRRVERYRADWVHDFAFTAWADFEEHEATGPHGVALRALVPPGFGGLARLQLDEAAAAMEDLEGWFGRYPYPNLTLVHPPLTAAEAGGMEYPTLICTGGGKVTSALGMRSVEGVTTHELAHQWFYGLLASDEHRHAFLDEGLTTFATARSMERRYGPGAGFQGFGLSVSHWAFARMAGAQAWQIGPLDLPTEGFASGSDYGVSVYPKTAVLMETLRRVYGDETFGAAMKRYTRAFRYGHPAPDDLVAAVRAEMGDAAATQLSAGIAGGFVDYAVARLERGESNTKARVILRRRGDLTFPVQITLREEDGTEVQRRWDGQGRTHVLVHEGQSPLASATVDPDLRVLMDRDLSNNHRSFDRTVVAARVQSWSATALGLVWAVLAP